jgi:hypothetical protein
MNISDITEPTPTYGIGAEQLVDIWIARERRLRERGDCDTAAAVHLMRRELQEAVDLVVDLDGQLSEGGCAR